jgi:hypothetical protein
MNIKKAPLAIGTMLAALSIGGGALAATTPWAAGAATHPAQTPDQCIQLNGGDWNACNVGNSGTGERQYLPVRDSGAVSRPFKSAR